MTTKVTAGVANIPGTPTGALLAFAGTTAPTGFLLCYGQEVSRTTYADLFSAIGTTYGVGDGSTAFNVPNLKSALPLGYGQRTETFTFVDGDVATGTEIITIDDNDWIQTGTALALTTDGVLPTGLSATTYYAIRVSSTTIKLATTVANANAGTAPIFTTNLYTYSLGLDGFCKVSIFLDADGGTDGAGAVDSRIATPYTNAGAFSTVTSTGIANSSVTGSQVVAMQISSGNSFFELVEAAGTSMQNGDFGNGGRTVRTSFTYKAF